MSLSFVTVVSPRKRRLFAQAYYQLSMHRYVAQRTTILRMFTALAHPSPPLSRCFPSVCTGCSDAERQFKSALKQTSMVVSYLELCKVYVKLDQPMTAIEHYLRALDTHPNDVSLLTGIARIYTMLNDSGNSETYYKKVLASDPSNVEAMASLAAAHFYTDTPEVGHRALLPVS